MKRCMTIQVINEIQIKTQQNQTQWHTPLILVLIEMEEGGQYLYEFKVSLFYMSSRPV